MFKQGTGKDDLHAHEILGVAGPLDLRTSSWKVCPQAFAAAEALLVLTAARRWGGTWLRGSAWRGWTTKIAIYPLNNLVVQIYRFYTTLYTLHSPPTPTHIFETPDSEPQPQSTHQTMSEKVMHLCFMSSGLEIDKLTGKLMKEHPATESAHESPRNGWSWYEWEWKPSWGKNMNNFVHKIGQMCHKIVNWNKIQPSKLH